MGRRDKGKEEGRGMGDRGREGRMGGSGWRVPGGAGLGLGGC